MDFKLMKVGDSLVIARHANTSWLRSLGLQGVNSLGPNEGCLLDFGYLTPISLWMKDCLMPLTAAFIDDTNTIVGIVDMNIPNNGVITAYHSPRPAVYALEMPLGFFEKNNVKIGDIVSFSE